MKIEKFIEIWLKEDKISPTQADKMIKSIDSIKKTEGKNNFIITLSTIISILLGIGILLFITSNWCGYS